MGGVRLVLLGILVGAACSGALFGGTAPTLCGARLAGWGHYYRQLGRLPDKGSLILDSNTEYRGTPEYQLGATPFYDPSALYLGIKIFPRGIHAFVIVRNQRLDGWRKGMVLLSVAKGSRASVNGSPLSESVRSLFSLNEFTDPLLDSNVPPASYGIIFKIPLPSESLRMAQDKMRELSMEESPTDCVRPAMAVMQAAGLQIENFDEGAKLDHRLRSLIESLLLAKLTFAGLPIQPSWMANDVAALDLATQLVTKIESAEIP